MTAEPLYNATISWYLTDNANCNPGGYAFVNENLERGKDFYFSVRGFNETEQPDNSSAVEGEDSADPDQAINSNVQKITDQMSQEQSTSQNSTDATMTSTAKK